MTDARIPTSSSLVPEAQIEAARVIARGLGPRRIKMLGAIVAAVLVAAVVVELV